jgi:radical SAM protein with 4Fe4S-binding SPASM domain
MPGVIEFIEYLNQKEPGVNKIFTTNGSPLINNDVLGLLTRSRSAVEISLHASNRELHRLLTRLDTFDQIVTAIKRLCSLRKNKANPNIVLVFLINTLNIENLPDFVEFAAGLGADEIICNYMTVFSRAHLKLSCFFKQEITNLSIGKAEEKAKKLKIPVRFPPKFGPSPQSNKARLCSDPWKYFYVENEGSILPCCNAGYHIGYLSQADFETIWNGSSYKYLRRSLTKDPIHEWCRYCLRHNSENINDIRSHISSRPGFKEKILKGYKL